VDFVISGYKRDVSPGVKILEFGRVISVLQKYQMCASQRQFKEPSFHPRVCKVTCGNLYLE